MVEQFLNGKVTLHAGDCMAALAELGEYSIDSCVTDPPYHLTSIVKRMGAPNAAPVGYGSDGRYQRMSGGFMGKRWDGGDVAFRPETWAAVYRVLKPGGYVLAFGGTRTYHRLACAIEDAGFEVRDMVSWLYGSGFPKSHDVSKGIDKAAGALEHRSKRFNHAGGGIVANSQHKPELRSDHPDYAPYSAATAAAREWAGWGTALKPALEPICMARKPLIGTVAANVLEHGTGAINVDGCRVGTADDQDNRRVDKGGGLGYHGGDAIDGIGRNLLGRWPANVIHDGSEEVTAGFPETHSAGAAREGSSDPRQQNWNGNVGNAPSNRSTGDMHRFGDAGGSAARFFYSAKADADDRIGSRHPTVKPVDLMQYLVRLVTPKGGTVLDPFAGTGTTGEAAWREGMRAVLIEAEAEYQADIARRMALVLAGPDERVRESVKARGTPIDYGPLFITIVE